MKTKTNHPFHSTRTHWATALLMAAGLAAFAGPLCSRAWADGDPDPGFPFVDANNDGDYTSGLDLGAPDGFDIVERLKATGQFYVDIIPIRNAGIVFPASTDPLTLDGIGVKADGRIEIAGSLHFTAVQGDLTIRGGEMVIGDGVHLEAAGDLVIESAGNVTIGDHVSLVGQNVIISAGAGAFSVDAASIGVGSHTRIQAANQVSWFSFHDTTLGDQSRVAAPIIQIQSLVGNVSDNRVHLDPEQQLRIQALGLELVNSWIHGDQDNQFLVPFNNLNLAGTRILPED